MEAGRFLRKLGIRIREARKVRGVSQEKLAELSQMHPSHVSEIERGKTNASISSYLKIARALEMSLAELMDLPGGKGKLKTELQVIELLSRLYGIPKRKRDIFLSAILSLVRKAG